MLEILTRGGIALIMSTIEHLSFYDLWIEYDKLQKIKLKVQSYRKFLNNYKTHLLPYFKNYLVEDITQDVYINWMLHIEKDTNYSFAYKKSLHISMVAILNYAMKFYGLERNIASLIGNFNRGKSKPTKINFWTIDEYKQFINVIDEFEYKTLFNALYSTGMRLGECLALTWNDFSKDTLDINKTITKDINPKTRKPYINAPKTPESIRKIKLDDELIKDLNKLKRMQKRCNNYSSEWFIFGGSKSLSQTTVGRKKDKYCELAKVKKIRLHDFRHSHATLLLSSNVPISVICQRLGHKDMATTLNIYTHLVLSDSTKAVEVLNSVKQG